MFQGWTRDTNGHFQGWTRDALRIFRVEFCNMRSASRWYFVGTYEEYHFVSLGVVLYTQTHVDSTTCFVGCCIVQTESQVDSTTKSHS